jgi:hypothetical protein
MATTRVNKDMFNSPWPELSFRILWKIHSHNPGMFLLVLLPICLIRFIVFVPFGYYWAHAKTHWDVIEFNPVLSHGLYNPAIAAGEQIASNWGTFAFYWNFAVWLPSLWFPPPLNLPFMVIDTVTTVYLARATHYQMGYAPHSKGACNAGAAYTWHRPPGANESFFEAAGRLNATVATPVSMCRSFAEEWQYGVALTFFYTLVSLLNIIAFVGALVGTKKRDESLTSWLLSLLKIAGQFAIAIPKGLAMLIVGLLYFLPEAIFRCLPLSFKSKVRLGRGFALKSGIGLEQQAELGVVELKDMHRQRRMRRFPRYEGTGGEASPLSRFLGVYDMLMCVTEELHYCDIVQLSRVSKRVREAVLAERDPIHRRDAFKRYTCSGDTLKSACALCERQICSVSHTPFPLPSLIPTSQY